jgi:hypothetical protein
MAPPFIDRLDAVRVGVIALLAATTASAQATAPLGERLLVPHSSASRWLGDATACGGPLCVQAASGEFALPVMTGLRLVVGGGAGRVLDSQSSWLSERRVDLRYSGSSMSAWAGAVRADGWSSDTAALRSRLESGFRYATSNAEIALSFGAGRRVRQLMSMSITPDRTYHIDSGAVRTDTVLTPSGSRSEVLSIAELRASWSVGRFLLSTVAGRSTAVRSGPVAWGSFEVATPLRRGPLAFVNAGIAATPGFAGFIGVPRRSLSAGLRFSSATFASRSVDRRPMETASTAFIVKRESKGRYRLRIRVPNAKAVELASDCTGWKPIGLSHADGDAWEVIIPVSAGAHFVNVRVDGGTWIVPPGLIAKTDDFAGAVGVFVVD